MYLLSESKKWWLKHGGNASIFQCAHPVLVAHGCMRHHIQIDFHVIITIRMPLVTGKQTRKQQLRSAAISHS
jgi:hypothetical protein